MIKITANNINGDTDTTITGFDKVYNAVWNDYADCIKVPPNTDIEAGRCYYTDGINYWKTTQYCQKGTIGINSDIFGFVTGMDTTDNDIPHLNISVGGFVLAYVDKRYTTGTPLTSGPNGTLVKMKLLDRIIHPERIVGIFWKIVDSDTLNGIPVNGRYLIKIA